MADIATTCGRDLCLEELVLAQGLQCPGPRRNSRASRILPMWRRRFETGLVLQSRRTPSVTSTGAFARRPELHDSEGVLDDDLPVVVVDRKRRGGDVGPRRAVVRPDVDRPVSEATALRPRPGRDETRGGGIAVGSDGGIVGGRMPSAVASRDRLHSRAEALSSHWSRIRDPFEWMQEERVRKVGVHLQPVERPEEDSSE
jgi:hypothetical protein